MFRLTALRTAFRGLRRSPVSMGVAWLSIMLSVGATAVVFAAIDVVLIQPLPYGRNDSSSPWTAGSALPTGYYSTQSGGLYRLYQGVNPTKWPDTKTFAASAAR